MISKKYLYKRNIKNANGQYQLKEQSGSHHFPVDMAFRLLLNIHAMAINTTIPNSPRSKSYQVKIKSGSFRKNIGHGDESKEPAE